jgi:hypothetical protein
MHETTTTTTKDFTGLQQRKMHETAETWDWIEKLKRNCYREKIPPITRRCLQKNFACELSAFNKSAKELLYVLMTGGDCNEAEDGIVRSLNTVSVNCPPRETMLTIETEANGDSWSTNVWCPSLVGSLGSSCWYKIFLSCLGYSSQPSTKYFFPRRTIFHFIIPHSPATWVGSRAGSPACLVLGPCVRLHYFFSSAVYFYIFWFLHHSG